MSERESSETESRGKQQCNLRENYRERERETGFLERKEEESILERERERFQCLGPLG